MVIDRAGPLRLLLRAELTHGDQRAVTHTLEICDQFAVLRADAPPPLGSDVEVRLSFPGLAFELSLSGRVASRKLSSRPGEQATVTVEWQFRDDDERAKLEAFLSGGPINALGGALGGVRRSPDALAAARYRVLLVEDNNLVRDMFSFGVEKYFHDHPHKVSVSHATSSEQAWRLLEGDHYDLAIVDHYLPATEGAHFVSRVRRDERHAGLVVIGISSGGPDVKQAMLSAGADLFLDKPLVLRDLFATLERLVAVAGVP